MTNLDNITNKNNEKHNKKRTYIPDQPYRISIIGGSGSGKTNPLLNLIKEKKNIYKTYFLAKHLSEPKYKFLIKKLENARTKQLKNSKAFIEYSNTMNEVFENIDDCNPSKKRKILIVFDDMIADIKSNKKIQTIIKELFI